MVHASKTIVLVGLFFLSLAKREMIEAMDDATTAKSHTVEYHTVVPDIITRSVQVAGDEVQIKSRTRPANSLQELFLNELSARNYLRSDELVKSPTTAFLEATHNVVPKEEFDSLDHPGNGGGVQQGAEDYSTIQQGHIMDNSTQGVDSRPQTMDKTSLLEERKKEKETKKVRVKDDDFQKVGTNEGLSNEDLVAVEEQEAASMPQLPDSVPFFIYEEPEMRMMASCGAGQAFKYSSDSGIIHEFGAGSYFSQMMASHPWRCLDPAKAKVFVVPIDIAQVALSGLHQGNTQSGRTNTGPGYQKLVSCHGQNYDEYLLKALKRLRQNSNVPSLRRR